MTNQLSPLDQLNQQCALAESEYKAELVTLYERECSMLYNKLSTASLITDDLLTDLIVAAISYTSAVQSAFINTVVDKTSVAGLTFLYDSGLDLDYYKSIPRKLNIIADRVTGAVTAIEDKTGTVHNVVGDSADNLLIYQEYVDEEEKLGKVSANQVLDDINTAGGTYISRIQYVVLCLRNTTPELRNGSKLFDDVLDCVGIYHQQLNQLEEYTTLVWLHY